MAAAPTQGTGIYRNQQLTRLYSEVVAVDDLASRNSVFAMLMVWIGLSAIRLQP
jgi:hypothetical protein